MVASAGLAILLGKVDPARCQVQTTTNLAGDRLAAAAHVLRTADAAGCDCSVEPLHCFRHQAADLGHAAALCARAQVFVQEFLRRDIDKALFRRESKPHTVLAALTETGWWLETWHMDCVSECALLALACMQHMCMLHGEV